MNSAFYVFLCVLCVFMCFYFPFQLFYIEHVAFVKTKTKLRRKNDTLGSSTSRNV